MKKLLLIFATISLITCLASSSFAQDKKVDPRSQLAIDTVDNITFIANRGVVPLPTIQTPKLDITLTCNAPAAQCLRFRDAIAAAYGYTDTIPDPNNPGSTIPNPVSKQAFIVRIVRQFLIETASTYEARIAGQDAQAAKKAELENALKEPQLVIKQRFQ